ncbi:EthD domain-containing protein [Bordetella petrii]|uniref:EthD domain-containing protein n=1 Tax=Bordetella petrii TaxID=94624 RepID=UPI00372E8F75
MVFRMGLIRKRPDWTQVAFERHWRDVHGPLARALPGLCSYWQNVVTERAQRGIDYARGPWDFDGFSQLRFDGGGAALPDGAPAGALAADERHFLGDLHILTVQPTEVVAPPSAPARAGLLKRMSLLRRRDDMDEAAFRREWRAHAEHVCEMPGVAGYRQNVVLARERVKGQACDYAGLPIDGIVELWFEDAARLEAAFRGDRGRRTMAHARTFLAEITVFAVRERDVLADSGAPRAGAA